MELMARHSSSPRLVGRDTELVALIDAVTRQDDERRVVLVDGEAGIGKTRLLTELVARLRERGGDHGPADVVRGSCLALSEGELPFAPVLEILDGLDAQPDVASDVEPVRTELAGGLAASAGGTSTRGRLFERVRDVLVRAAEPSGLIVIIDDLHWADRSTLDLLVFLARRLRSTNVLIIAAYRSDELHRRHPLRPVLAELTRGFVREQVDLGPLSTEAIGDQVEAIVGHDDPALRRRIAERADGNPFHAEELVAIDAGDVPLPASLREVLLARLRTLDPATVELLGVCAVVGFSVDEAILTAVSNGDPATIRDGFRDAVEHSILVPTEDGRSYRFRHALLQEAVYDDLLPADRVGLHRRVADAIAADPSLRCGSPAVEAAELARHRDAAGELDLAFEGYLEAGAAAFRATAWAEAASAFDRASAIAASRGGAAIDPRLVAELPSAAFAVYYAGDPQRAMALLRAWIDRAKAEHDHATAVELLVCLSRLQNTIGDEPGSRSSTAEAVALDLPEDRIHARATLAADRSSGAWMRFRFREAVSLSSENLPLAEAAGDTEIVIHLLTNRATSLTQLGRFDEAAADFERIASLQSSQRSVFEMGVTITNRAWALAESGELDAGEALLRDALRIAADLDVRDDWDPWNLSGLVYIATIRGDWQEALDLIDRSRALETSGIPLLVVEHATALLAARRGDVSTAAQALEDARSLLVGIDGLEAWLGLTAAQVAQEIGDPFERLARVRAGLEALEGCDLISMWSWLAAQGASAAADVAEVSHGRRAAGASREMSDEAHGFAALAEDVAAGSFIPGSASTRLTRANAAFAGAEAARAEGLDDPETWTTVASAFEELGYRPQVAEIRYREAAASLRQGNRERARQALGVAHSSALDLGMVPLARRIMALAKAGRLDLAATEAVATDAIPAGDADARSTTPAGESWGLTEREREVLALVAAGRTNGQIGAALFISTKTASVHVTHILDKMGVSSRTEAALLAIQAGLLDPVADEMEGIGLRA
jgi:DNA-binding CsgD family transcriptional regulator/tetratricopeptide (TPR) repeat protein